MEPENSERSGRDFSRKIPYWWRQSSPNSTPQSCIISILTFAWDKMADSANCWCFQAASRVENRERRLNSGHWRHQYGIFRQEVHGVRCWRIVHLVSIQTSTVAAHVVYCVFWYDLAFSSANNGQKERVFFIFLSKIQAFSETRTEQAR